MVGAVLVHDGKIIGEGWHKLYGKAHAEIDCIENVSEQDRDLIPHSTMYVSLEPCAHFGKTPPCANRLVAEGIRKVVVCNTDPFAQVDGKGIAILQQNGAEVTTAILEDAGRWINRRFFCMHEQQRPYVILKWAQTGDGFIAPADGSRLQISNRHSSELVHKWRTEEDAIMIGYNTAVNDNPHLTARHWQGKNPLRIVVDKNLQLPHRLSLFDNEAETWVLNSRREGADSKVRYVQLDFAEDIIPQLLQRLHAAGKQSLIVEGGAVLLRHFIDAGLWDEARVFAGNVSLQQGIAAPELKLPPAMTMDIADDILHVYINPLSRYPFVNGYDL